MFEPRANANHGTRPNGEESSPSSGSHMLLIQKATVTPARLRGPSLVDPREKRAGGASTGIERRATTSPPADAYKRHSATAATRASAHAW